MIIKVLEAFLDCYMWEKLNGGEVRNDVACDETGKLSLIVVGVYLAGLVWTYTSDMKHVH